MRQSRRAAKRRAAQQQVSDTQKSQQLQSLSPVQQDGARSTLGGTVSVPVHIDPSELVHSSQAAWAAEVKQCRLVLGSSSANIQAAFDALSYQTQTVAWEVGQVAGAKTPDLA